MRKWIILLSLILLMLTGNFFVATKAEAWSGKLYRGMKGSEVRILQQSLQELRYNPGTIDGVFGSQTEKAVKDFQRKHGLVVDGVAGWQSLMEIDRTLANPRSSRRSVSRGFSRNTLYLLAQAIHGEARGESYEGQVAVGAVILNRARSSQFPKTISGVIYQPRQFDCVYDGQINLRPSQTALNAAQDALRGWDPSVGALYYYNPLYTKDTWILTRPIIKRIGAHVFAR